jgi:hypothetical protein
VASSRASGQDGITGWWERTQAWVITFRKLGVRYERHAATVRAFLYLSCALTCLRFVAYAEAAAH